MLGRGMMMGGGLAAIFRSAAVTPTSTSTITKPSGVAVGDLVAVWATGVTGSVGLSTTGGGAWNASTDSPLTGYGWHQYVFWKILTSTDVSNAWVLASAPVGAVAVAYYRNDLGLSAFTTKAVNANSANHTNTLALTGFTKAGVSKGVIACIWDADVDASDTVPSGFTQRVANTYGLSGRTVIADNLAQYVDGATVTWTATDGPTSGLLEAGILGEMT